MKACADGLLNLVMSDLVLETEAQTDAVRTLHLRSGVRNLLPRAICGHPTPDPSTWTSFLHSPSWFLFFFLFFSYLRSAYSYEKLQYPIHDILKPCFTLEDIVDLWDPTRWHKASCVNSACHEYIIGDFLEQIWLECSMNNLYMNLLFCVFVVILILFILNIFIYILN